MSGERADPAAARPRRVIVTGAPGAGKTTLLDALQARGFHVVPDTARAIIRDRLSRGLPPRPAPAEFAREILRIDIERYRNAPAGAATLFFERGIPDALGMLRELGVHGPAETERHLADFPYHRRVFVPPPWEAIYRTDEERDQTFPEALRVHDTICGWYARCGYEIVEIPRASVDERCAFVLRTLSE
ncbi:MAG TPA: AAA family ATPase [Candidatus Eisenbacteria bacterium]|nr:AAA family ATPase [Candidatus Eisenbacteria bacterium]